MATSPFVFEVILVNARSHIVHFSTKSRKNVTSTEFCPLPVLIKNIQSICVEELQAKLVNMLDTADDRLFDMADSSPDNAQFHAMRLLRVKRSGLIISFKQALIDNFKQTLGKKNLSEEYDGNVEELSFENIALVDEDQLEADIATDAMVNKAKNTNEKALEHVRIRLDTLVTDRTIEQATNPLEPVFICDAFRTASKILDLDIASMLIIYKLFDRSVISELALLYQQINQFFIDKGILPELKNTRLKIRKAPNSLDSAVQDNMDALAAESDEKSDTSIEQSQMLDIIQQLMFERRVANGNDVPSGQSSQGKQVDTQQLLQALSKIQINQQSLTATEGAIQPENLRESLGSSFSQVGNNQEIGVLGQFNEDMIDIVSMLFDFILEDDNLQAEIKYIIARLQIPMLKVGLSDKTFFSNRRHPARALLNELAHAGLSWDKKDPSAQAMFDKISYVAERVIKEFDQDPDLFVDLLEEFSLFKKQNNQKAQIFERRIKEAEEGKARTETARSVVNRSLSAICKGQNIPQVVKLILKNVWSHVMLLERLKGNDEAWKRRVKVAQLLVWSVQPIETAERLEKLTSKITLLIKHLRKGMELISLSTIEASTLFEQLENYHRQIVEVGREKINEQTEEEILRLPARDVTSGLPDISGLDETEISPEQEAADETKEEVVCVEDIGFSRIDTGEAFATKMVEPVHIGPEISQTIEQLRAGSWVELKVESVFKRCKLAAKIASSGKFIFVNRSGMKMAEFLTSELCQYLQLGSMKILDDEALFDRALESVISNLRTMKAQA